MKSFLDNNFLLQNETAQTLYNKYAAPLSIIDYHCHLSPQQIADDIQFENLTQAWLYGDHYKWRAMRTNGVDEHFITGNATDWEKFEQWAATVPYTLRNPLYHWTHIELQRYFGIDDILNSQSAKKIYDECSRKLQTKEYSIRNLLRRMKVQVICTTDDPVDTLEYHQKIKENGFEIRVLPTFRPDKAMEVSDAKAFNAYVEKLQRVSNTSIVGFADFLASLKSRHDYFASLGCCLSDHGLEEMYADDFTENDIQFIFNELRSGNNVSMQQQRKFKSKMLLQFAEWDWEKNWVQQFHLGALRNNNSRALKTLGADTGWDSTSDFPQAKSLSLFLDKLNGKNKLAKTILYNLNPADNDVMATMIGNFNDGSVRGKMQWGSAWWFLDQKDGMTKQLNTLSNAGLLSCFVGMLTDSRSFLSYPRHEYFRRILCNLFGEEIEKGELPDDIEWTGKVVQDICYHNAINYFNFGAK